MPWHKSYRHRYKFTIDNTNIDSNLTDFPVALFISSSCGTGTDDLTKIFDTVGARWMNLCVTASNEKTPLWTEVDLWDETNEVGVLHVRVPKISSSETTDIFLYFDADGPGNGFIGDIGSDAGKNVWDDNFVAVHHLSRDATGIQKDSTGNSDATTYNLEADDSENSGGLQGLEFDGTNEYAANTDVDAQSLTSDFHPEVYAYVVDGGNREELFNKFDLGNTKGWGINTQHNVNGEYYAGFKYTNFDYHVYASSTYLWGNGETHYFSFYYKGDGTKPTFYVDGVDRTTDFSVNTSGGSGGISGLTDSGIGLQWGRGNTMRGTTYYSSDVLVLETRLSTGERSAAWIKATYYTLADNIGEWQALEAINVPAEGWLASWKYRRKITIPHANVSADLENFPLALWLSSSAGETSIDMTPVFDELGANSHKIAVTDHSGVRQLFVEIDNWDDTAEEAIIHVGVPFIDSAVDTTLYFYYDADKADNDGYVGDPGDAAAQNVWDEYFMGVWHLNEAPTSGGIDSTRNANNLSHINMEAGDVGDMYPGKGWTFGANELAYDDTLTSQITDYPITMEVMGIYDGVNVNPQMNYCRDVSDSLFLEVGMLVASDVGRANLYSGATYAADGTVTVTADEFVYLAGRWESKDLHYIFTNGADKQSYTNADKTFPAYSDRCLTISGRNDASNNYFEGQVSEARVSSVARSDAWIAVTNSGITDALLQFAEEGEEVAEVGWLRGFGKRSKISIPSTNIDGALDYFPLALHLSSSCGTGADDMTAVFDEIGANSRKLAVTLADGRTQCPIEIELWDDTGEEAVLHVRVPNISSSDTTYLYLYFSADVPDNNEYVGGIGDSPTMLVWSEYSAVYHFATDPSGTAPQALDSTENANHGTAGGTMLTGDYVDGKVGKAWDFDGSDDNFTAPDDDSFDIGTGDDLTIEAVINSDTASASALILDNRASSSAGFLFGVHSDNTIHLFLTDSVDTAEPGGDTTLTRDGSTWYYIGGRFDRNGDNDADVWLNAADDVTSTTSTTAVGDLTNTATKYFADNAITSSWANWSGEIAEIRISKVYRQDAWMKATYYSLFDTLLSYNTNIETEDNWLGDWKYRIQCRIDSSLIDADLTDFPVAVHLSAASGLNSRDVTAIFDELGANSLKIAVATASGTQCYVEVDFWDSSSDMAVLHTKIPSVKSDRDTIFYLYYDLSKSDNSTYVGVPGSAAGQAVWDDNFVGVYHMSQDPSGTAPQMLDSTSNANHMTSAGTMLTEDLVDEKPGKGIDFDGSNDILAKTSATNVISAYPYTIEVAGEANVVASTNTNPYAGVMDASAADQILIIGIYDGYGRMNHYSGASNTITGTTLLVDGEWCHLAGVGVSTTSRFVYTNGGNATEDTDSDAFPTGLDKMTIGGAGDTSPGYYAGIVSEVRYSNTNRSAAWIKATYNTLADTLVYLGADEKVGTDWSAFVGWGQRYPFEIPSTNIDADVAGIPITIVLGSSVGTGSDDMTAVFDEVGANKRRIAVGAANGKPVPCEVDIWDESGEVAVLYVKAPFIEANYGALLYLYYSNDQNDKGWAEDTGEYMAQRVWDDNFTAVYHLSQDPSGAAPQMLDSTEKENHMTSQGTMLTEDLVDTIPGKGIDFDGNNDLLLKSNPANCPTDYPMTMETAGVHTTGNPQPNFFFVSGVSDVLQSVVNVRSSDNYGQCGQYTNAAIGTVAVGDGEFAHVGGQFVDRDTLYVLTNGGDKQSDLGRDRNFFPSSSRNLCIGGKEDFGNNYYTGIVSECRMSDIIRSDAWLKVTYYTLYDNLGDWGDFETEPVGGEIEINIGKTGIEFDPKALSTELSIELWLGKVAIQFQTLPLAASYIGNVVKLVRVEGSRPRVAAASSRQPGIAKATGRRPRLAAAEAFAYQAERDPN